MCEITPPVRVSLPASLESAALVRDFVESAACPAHGGQAMVALQLLASELVTNAVLYGAAPIWAEISCAASSMRVEVHDENRDGSELSASDGMGLLLVNKVAHEWGTTPTGTGKTVWCSVRTGVVPAQRTRSWDDSRVSRPPRVRPVLEARSGAGTAPH